MERMIDMIKGVIGKRKKVFLKFLVVTMAVSNLSIPLGIDNHNPEVILAATSDFVIENGVLTQYTGKGGKVTIPNEVNVIGNSAFSGCAGLVHITIPNSVISIDDFAFAECNSLTEVYISGEVDRIGNEAFSGCTSLAKVTISEGVGEIGNCAFNGCTGLKTLQIPASVDTIGESAFGECSGLTNATLLGQISKLERFTFAGCSKLEKISLPDTVESIGDYAFSSCSKLAEVNLSKVTSIGNCAFYDCSSLTSIVIPASVTQIGENAFEDSALVKIVGESGSYASTFAKQKQIPFTVYEAVETPTPQPQITEMPTPVVVPATQIPVPTGSEAAATPIIQPTQSGIETTPVVQPTQSGVEATPIVQPTQSAVIGTTVPLITATQPAITVFPTLVPNVTPSALPVESMVPGDGSEGQITPAPNSQISIKKVEVSFKKKTYYSALEKKVEAKVVVTYKKKKLKLGRDYTVKYKDNKKYGAATAIISGKGNYSGKTEAKFWILPQQAKILKAKIYKYANTKAVQLTWKKQKGVFGYEILYTTSKKGKYKNAARKDAKVTKAIFSFPHKKIYMKMRAYIVVDGKYKYGTCSKVKLIK